MIPIPGGPALIFARPTPTELSAVTSVLVKVPAVGKIVASLTMMESYHAQRLESVMLIGAGSESTLRENVWKQPPNVAVMVTAGLNETPHTVPPAVTEAAAGLLDDHTTPGLDTNVEQTPTHKCVGPMMGVGINPSLPKLVPPGPKTTPATPVVENA